jgi:hypothetical protein
MLKLLRRLGTDIPASETKAGSSAVSRDSAGMRSGTRPENGEPNPLRGRAKWAAIAAGTLFAVIAGVYGVISWQSGSVAPVSNAAPAGPRWTSPLRRLRTRINDLTLDEAESRQAMEPNLTSRQIPSATSSRSVDSTDFA